jgi:hypothetical protein
MKFVDLVNKGQELVAFIRAERKRYRAKVETSVRDSVGPSIRDSVGPSVRDSVGPSVRDTNADVKRTAEVVSGVLRDEEKTPYRIYMEHFGPGTVFVKLEIGTSSCATIQWDNFVKIMTRLDPEHATGPERQILGLRMQLSHANGKVIDLGISEQQLRSQLLGLRMQLSHANGKVIDLGISEQQLRSQLNDQIDETDKLNNALTACSERADKAERALDDAKTQLRMMMYGDDVDNDYIGAPKLPLDRNLTRVNMLTKLLDERDQLRSKIDELEKNQVEKAQR